MEFSWIKILLDQSWPSWEPVRMIGKGSYGTVYEIQKNNGGKIDRQALKVISIPEEGTALPIGKDKATLKTYYTSIADGMVREYDTMKELMAQGCTNVVRCDNYVKVPNSNGVGLKLLIKMELLTDLNTYCRKHGFTRQNVIQLGIDICYALEACRKTHVIHRDIKPANLFVSADGKYKLGDFGVAKQLEQTGYAGSKQGTILYMAPEVYKNQNYDGRADMYSLGLVMYQLLNNGQLPFATDEFDAQSQNEALTRRMRGEPLPLPALETGTLAQIVCHACEPDYRDRYADPATMRLELEQLLDPTDQKIYISPVEEDEPSIQIRFMNGDQVLQERIYQSGEQIEQPKMAPEVKRNGKLYQFLGWEPALPETATMTMDYRARYKEAPAPEKPHWKRNWRTYIAAAAVVALIVSGVAAMRLMQKSPIQELVSSDHDKEGQQYVESAAGIRFQGGGDAASCSAQALSVEDDDYQTLLEDGYACIGFYDVIMRGLQGVVKITFPVDSHYEGRTVEIAHISDTGIPETTQAVVADGAVTIATTTSSPYLLQVKPEAGKEWSQWTDQLPASISADDYVIESALLSRSREKETKTSEEEKLPGWTLGDIEIGEVTEGEWSEWSITPITPRDDLKVEHKTEYRYRDRQTKSSSDSVMTGWTLYETMPGETKKSEWSEWSTEHPGKSPLYNIEEKTQYRYRSVSLSSGYSAWGEWSEWQDAAVSENDVTDVETRTAYHYYYYVCSSCGAHMHGYGQCYTWAGGCGKNTVDRGTYHMVRYTTPYQDAKDFHGTTVYYAYGDEGIAFAYINSSSPHYVAPLTQYRFCTRTVEQKETKSEWSPWDDTPYTASSTREVETREVYRYQVIEASAVYWFYKWGEWSPWGTTEYTASENREVETQILYRSCTLSKESIYHFWRWSDTWSDWSFSSPDESEDVQVVTAVCYRYCRKT